jgi:hypothetical protein
MEHPMRIAIASLAMIVSSSLWAADVKIPLTPGQWEITSKMQHSDPKVQKAMEEAQKAIADMPPEQRKMMEDMMRKQGMQISSSGDGSTTITMCITQAMVDESSWAHQKGTGCTHNLTGGNGKYQMSFNCKDPATSGTGEYNFTGSDAYDFKMDVISGAGSKAQKMQMSGSGKLLNKNCNS